MNSIKQFLNDEDGVTALEYGLLAAVVGGALIAVAPGAIKEFFNDIFAHLKTLGSSAAAGGPSS